MKKIVFTLLMAAFSYGTSYGGDAKEIMQKVLDRENGNSQYSVQTVSTCRYEVKKKTIACAETPRTKVVETIRKDYGPKGKDIKSVSLILEPSSERGIGFLQYDYEDQEKESDQWMYLSALGKVKRVVSGRSDEPKTGTLFGSEISYEDVEVKHIDDFIYTLLIEEKYDGRECWVIESVPTPKHARKSNYSKTVQWIDKERLVVYRAIMYDRHGKPAKQMTQSDYVLKDGVWIAKKMNINNVQSRRISTLKLDDVAINIAVDDSLFTERTLTDDSFREGNMRDIRVAKK
ncbi:MAG: outer membrane lipoprotein-sorting protein [Nitrospinota bacterium]|nr:outer membrane lipoprotein-sorting protein [Nitrospinota bacterium]